jgi:hypothetical protein
MKLNQGLNLDTVPVNMSEGTYPYAKNIIINDKTGTLINEPGFTSLSILPSDHKFCGYIEMEGDKYVVFTHDDSSETLADGTQRAGYIDNIDFDGTNYTIIYFTPGGDVASGESLSEGTHTIKHNSTMYNVLDKGATTRKLAGGESRQYNYVIFDRPGTAPFSGSITEMDASGGVDYIGFIENNLYTAVSTSISFLFHPRFPVTGTYRYTNAGDVEIVFRDLINYPKLCTFNIKDGILEDNKEKTYQFRKLKFPIYDLGEVTGGGSLKEGAYFFSIRYTYENGGYTDAFPPSHPVYVPSSKLREEGLVVNAGKKIRMKISNLDTNFEGFELIVLAKVEGIINSYVVNEYAINSSTEWVTYNGTENVADITLDEVLVKSAAFNDVGSYTSLNGVLYGADVTTSEGGDLQTRATDITVKWYTFNPKRFEGYTTGADWLVHDGYEQPKTAFYRKGFRPGEVYALYISWIKDGRLTRAYHIPGRPVANLTLKLDDGSSGQILGGERWTHKNIIDWIPLVYPGRNVDYLQDDMAIIEGGDDADTGVRYYQTRDAQSTTVVIESTDPPEASGQMAYWENEDEVYPDDFPVSAGNPVRHHKIPSENFLLERISELGTTYYEEGNTQVALKVSDVDVTGYDGYVIFYAKPEHTILGESVLHTEKLYDLAPFSQEWDTTGLVASNDRKFRYHDIGMLFDKPPLSATHVINQFYVDLNANDPGTGQAEVFKVNLADFKEFIRPLDRSVGLRYVPNHNAAADNKYREEHISGALATDLTKDDQYHFVSLLARHARNLYTSYKNQTLILTGALNTADTSIIYGGDCYINDVIEWYKLGSDSTFRPYANSIHGLHSRYNFAWRNYGENWWEQPVVHPDNITDDLVGTDTVYTLAHTKTIQYTDYNKDYSALQDMTSPIIFNNRPIVRKYGSRIIRSVKQSNESPVSSWRTFLPANYYELEKETGDIIKLEPYKSELIIRTENAMYITRGKAQMQTDAVAVTLGTGDIFEFEPVNIVKGFAGIDNWYNSLVTKAGVFSVDPKNNKIFLYTGEIDEISSGIRTYIRDVDLSNSKLAYDDYYNRFILTNNLFTLSYSLWTNTWVCFHSYTPQWIFGNLSLYSITGDTNMWLHNSGAMGTYYDTLYPSFVDGVFNGMPQDTKVVANVEYVDEIRDASDAKQRNSSCTHLSVRNHTQHTGLIPVIPKTQFLGTGNLEKEKDNWIFSQFQDQVDDPTAPIIDDIANDYDVIAANLTEKAWYEKDDLSDKFAIVRFYHDNQSGDKWKLIEVGVNFLRPE